MKKLLSLVIAVAMVFSLMCFSMAGADEVRTVEGGRMSNGFRWTYYGDEKVLTVYGSGYMPDVNEPAPWDAYREEIVVIIISDGIESLPDNCFVNLPNLTTIIISPTVTAVGSGLFNGCDKLKYIAYQGELDQIRNLLAKEANIPDDVVFLEYVKTEETEDNGTTVENLLHYTLKDGTTITLRSGETKVLDDGVAITNLGDGKVQTQYNTGDAEVTITTDGNETKAIIKLKTAVKRYQIISEKHSYVKPTYEENIGYEFIYDQDGNITAANKLYYQSFDDAEPYKTEPDTSIVSGKISLSTSGNKTIIEKIEYKYDYAGTDNEGYPGGIYTVIFDQDKQTPVTRTRIQENGITGTEEINNGVVTSFDSYIPSQDGDISISYQRTSDDNSIVIRSQGNTIYTQKQDDNVENVYEMSYSNGTADVVQYFNTSTSKKVEEIFYPYSDLVSSQDLFYNEDGEVIKTVTEFKSGNEYDLITRTVEGNTTTDIYTDKTSKITEVYAEDSSENLTQKVEYKDSNGETTKTIEYYKDAANLSADELKDLTTTDMFGNTHITVQKAEYKNSNGESISEKTFNTGLIDSYNSTTKIELWTYANGKTITTNFNNLTDEVKDSSGKTTTFIQYNQEIYETYGVPIIAYETIYENGQPATTYYFDYYGEKIVNVVNYDENGDPIETLNSQFSGLIFADGSRLFPM